MRIPALAAYAIHTPETATEQTTASVKSAALRALIVGVGVTAFFAAVATQLIRLAIVGQAQLNAKPAQIIGEFYSRPDIVDREGRLLVTDVSLPTLYADPYLIASVDETVEGLATIFPELDTAKVRRALADKKRRYYPLKRAVTPTVAQRIHDMGLPGLAFRNEPKRSYPNARLAGHLLGYVDGYNHGIAGVERLLNGHAGIRRVHRAMVNTAPPLHLTIDMRTQYALERELRAGMATFNAKAAAGVLLDVNSGEIWAAASLPGVEPSQMDEVMDRARRNRLSGDAFELGSVFKVFTLAMALDLGIVTPTALIDVSTPLKIGRFTISDDHPHNGKLTLEQVLVRSSNIGAGALAEAAGAQRQRIFLEHIGLTNPIDTHDVKTVAPKLPRRWGAAETITIGFGHGIAVSPMQFAIVFASMVNGGTVIGPTVRHRPNHATTTHQRRVISAETSRRLRQMLRENVLRGTGRRARVAGYRVGGKTGTADLARNGKYDGKSVITSFAAAFPMDKPRFDLLVTLFDPQPEGGKAARSAGRTAAPVAGSIIRRVAPVLGMTRRAAESL